MANPDQTLKNMTEAATATANNAGTNQNQVVAQTSATNNAATNTAAAATNKSYNYDSTQPVRSQMSGTYTPTGIYDPNNLAAYNQQQEQRLRELYEQAGKNTEAALKTAYDQNMSDLQAVRDKLDPQYQQSMNELGAEYERQRRNNNIQAQANGINTGAGSQMQLAQSNAYQAGQAQMQRAKNDAINDAQKRISDLQIKYQNDIAQAAANNDYQLAAALYQEYQQQYQRQMQVENTNFQRTMDMEAQAYQRAYNEENRDYNRQWSQDERDYNRQQTQAALLASFGDFSGYEGLYGYDKETIDQMRQLWLMQNPSLAYTLGQLSADDYLKLTGSKAPDILAAEQAAAAAAAASRSGGRGGGYYYGGGQPADTGTETGSGIRYDITPAYDDQEDRKDSYSPYISYKTNPVTGKPQEVLSAYAIKNGLIRA